MADGAQSRATRETTTRKRKIEDSRRVTYDRNEKRDEEKRRQKGKEKRDEQDKSKDRARGYKEK